MKRILLLVFLILFASTTFAQSKTDSVEVLRDTINISGKVLDEYNEYFDIDIFNCSNSNYKEIIHELDKILYKDSARNPVNSCMLYFP